MTELKMLDLPHASKQLHQSTVSESDADNEVWLCDTAGAHVDQAQDKGGESESTQAQWSRVGEFAILDALVQTRLELTTESRETTGVGSVDMSKRAIAEFGGGDSSLVFFMGHLAAQATIGGIVGVLIHLLCAGDVVASMVGIGCGGHVDGRWCRRDSVLT